ncbi:MAG TPA: histidine phosphatase family protein [Bacillota bacterium]|nr:histidine phosphatase family protein [Bacillota bacterium]
MKNIYLIRHCTAAGQHPDSPLTRDGLRQAVQLKDFFISQNIDCDRIISSPYLRAIDSIRPYAEQIGLPIDVDERLKERILSDRPIDDWLDVLEQSFHDHHFRLPGGESAYDALTRAKDVFASLDEHEDVMNVMIVSHGNLIALVLQQLDEAYGFDQWKQLRNPDIYKICYDENVVSVECIW